MDTPISTTDWYAALSLDERLPAPAGEVDPDLGARRLDRWRASPPFQQADLFARRLAAAGIDDEGLRRVLGEPPRALAGRVARPAFAGALATAFEAGPATDLALPDGPLAPAEPVIAAARDRLRAVIDNIRRHHPEAPFDAETVIDLLLPALTAPLGAILGRTFVLELQVARLLGRLDGETPEARYASFARSLRVPDQAIALFREYPVLARLVQETADDWVAASGEFLERLARDAGALRDTFTDGKPLGALVALDGGRGDRHRGGRAVMIAAFDSGLRVVYKPRSLAVEEHFQQLLGWLNARGASPVFPTLTVLDRGDHGWVEVVAGRPCASRDEVRRFYARQGGYLALLYAVEATDFHFENLIAAGEHPVLLDLEALFHPRIHQADSRPDDAGDTGLLYSVLGVGLLPQRIWDQHGGEGIDISGLGGSGGQLTPHPALALDGAGTDEMRMTRRRMPVPASHNLPTLDGRHPDLADYAGDLIAGFERTYRLLLAHRGALLAADGPIAAFAGDELRVILRPTQLYGRLLQESHHPDLLRDALDRDRLLDRLWGWIDAFPALARAVPHEQADLRRGDIPVFTTVPGSRDLRAASGERIPAFFATSGMDLVRRRIAALSDEDLDRQVWIVRASLVAAGAGGQQGVPAYRLAGSRRAPDRDHLLAEARRVGDRLAARAIREPGQATWVGLHAMPNRRWSLAPVNASLYDGQAGIALFLAYLGAVSGEHRYTGLARDAVASLRRLLDRERGQTATIGGYIGWGGAVHALAHLGTLWSDPTLLDEAEAVVELIPPLLASDTAFDVLSGAAGAAAALLALDAARPGSRALAVATACAEHLLARAVPVPGGIGWAADGLPPLTGFTHGAAGIAWSLLGVAHRTGDDRFRRAARAAIAAERAVFDPAAGNWPDLRPPEAGGHTRPDGGPTFMATWCHGAPGIALGRLRSVALDADPVAWDEVAVAARTTRASGFGAGHSLCHGDLGNLEILEAASARLGLDREALGLDRLAGAIVASIARDGWMCGVPSGLETPGLMTGIAGIGYALLRLAAPADVPSVLALQPPASAAVVEVAA